MNNILAWEALITQAISLGVKSWKTIEALLDDAGADKETVDLMKLKYDGLVASVRRAAGL